MYIKRSTDKRWQICKRRNMEKSPIVTPKELRTFFYRSWSPIRRNYHTMKHKIADIVYRTSQVADRKVMKPRQWRYHFRYSASFKDNHA